MRFLTGDFYRELLLNATFSLVCKLRVYIRDLVY